MESIPGSLFTCCLQHTDMQLRQIARGTLGWNHLEAVGNALADRLDRRSVRIEFVESDNWLSIPLVVDRRWFVKIITPQHARVHAILTGARNLGAVTSGAPGFFQRFDDPLDMAEHELAATRRIRELGLNAPRPIDAFEHEHLGIVVLEYLPEFQTIDELPAAGQRHLGRQLFEALAVMHDNGVVHGDLREDNVLLVDGQLYIIDATSVSEDWLPQGRAYDVASALGVLAPLLGPEPAVNIALEVYEERTVVAARRFLEFVWLRPDHDFNVDRVSRAIDRLTG